MKMGTEDLLIQCASLLLCVLGIYGQIFPTGCTLPSSWTTSTDWYCMSDEATKYTFDASSATVDTTTAGASGWVTGDKNFKITIGSKPLTVTNSCPIEEIGGCTELYLTLSSTDSTTNGAPLTIGGDNFFGWVEWRCRTTTDSKAITYGFPITLDDSATSFISSDAAAELKGAYEKEADDTTTPPVVVGAFTTTTAIVANLNNWHAFGKVDANTETYFMMDTAGDMYKVFKNASLTLSKTLYGEIIAGDDASGNAMAGPTVADACTKVFKTKVGEQTCSTSETKECSSLQISPKMMLTLGPMLLLQFFRK